MKQWPSSSALSMDRDVMPSCCCWRSHSLQLHELHDVIAVDHAHGDGDGDVDEHDVHAGDDNDDRYA